MAANKPPPNAQPPLCKCGCGAPVSWKPGVGWTTWKKGHAGRGRPGSRLGREVSAEERAKRSASLRARFAGKRRRDLDPTGSGVYATAEYLDARKALVEGRPCVECGSTHRIHAHHRIPGDDSTLIPLCGACHAREHHFEGGAGREPPPGEAPPLCACGCGKPVLWKRVRGWGTYLRGHGNAKVPALGSEPPPLCACGCGETTKYRHGKGWNRYKRGHEQRVTGAFRYRAKLNGST